MGYSIDWSDLEQRIQDQKAALLDTSQNMDPEGPVYSEGADFHAGGRRGGGGQAV